MKGGESASLAVAYAITKARTLVISWYGKRCPRVSMNSMFNFNARLATDSKGAHNTNLRNVLTNYTEKGQRIGFFG